MTAGSRLCSDVVNHYDTFFGLSLTDEGSGIWRPSFLRFKFGHSLPRPVCCQPGTFVAVCGARGTTGEVCVGREPEGFRPAQIGCLTSTCRQNCAAVTTVNPAFRRSKL